MSNILVLRGENGVFDNKFDNSNRKLVLFDLHRQYSFYCKKLLLKVFLGDT